MIGAGACLCLPDPAFAQERVLNFGAIKPTKRTNWPSFRQRFKPLTGPLPNHNVLLYKALQREIGEIEPHVQPVEGDCVAHSSAMACDILAAVNIHGFKKREDFIAKASVESIYWGSRVEIGGNQIPSMFAGSQVEWAAKFVNQYGVLHRSTYTKGDNFIDLQGYDGHRSRSRRSLGVPDWLESIARLHPVKEISRCNSGTEILEAICAGQIVVIGSSFAFPDVRDEYGFTTPFLGCDRCRRSGNLNCRQRRIWMHAMVITGAILEGPKTGGVCQNSHGAWNTGPRPWNMPEGSFGIETKYLDMMAKDFGEAWAFSSYHGHQACMIPIRAIRSIK